MASESKQPEKKKPAEGPATRRHLKEAKLLLKGVAKFLRYNDDLISPANKGKIAEHETEFRAAMEKPGVMIQELEELAGNLTKSCEKSVPGYKASAMRENIEVIFVAVVIAMGIRAYFAQPFKIPTGSMQPTLNGVIAYPHESLDPSHENATGKESPGLLKRMWDKVWYGRSWVNIVAENDTVVLLSRTEVDEDRWWARLVNRLTGKGDAKRVVGMREGTILKFFTYTYIPVGIDPKNPDKTYWVPGTYDRVRQLLSPEAFSRIVSKGTTIARGYIDTGDQVIVDKFSYHWVRPKNDDVFVFTTNNIPGIQSTLDPRMGSQHYIKRLAGVPGDKLEVTPEGNLLLNGEIAPQPGFQKVMSKENGYRGYQPSGPYTDLQLDEDEYFAMGDNSYNSADSRAWGRVPAKNIVGRAVFVYLPFGNHFGPIR